MKYPIAVLYDVSLQPIEPGEGGNYSSLEFVITCDFINPVSDFESHMHCWVGTAQR